MPQSHSPFRPMRLDRLELEWFRGAADAVQLELNGKSAVIYGANGSGKSSFVDAVEYILKDGKIGHLTHEYSGRKQEKGVINTHTPTLKPTRVTLGLTDGSEVRFDVRTNGVVAKSGTAIETVATWDYRRVVLRQDEVAAFIGSPKGEKYSALLPLLGLEPLEFAAENTRKLAKQVEKSSDLAIKRDRLRVATEKARQRFLGAGEFEQIGARLHQRYSPSAPASGDPRVEWSQLGDAIRERVAVLSIDGQRYAAIGALAAIDIAGSVADVRSAATNLAESAESFLPARLAVLESASSYADGNSQSPVVSCPACGREIAVNDLTAHLRSERSRLEHANRLYEAYRKATAQLSDDLLRLKDAFRNDLVGRWSTPLAGEWPTEAISYVQSLDAASVRRSCDEEQLRQIEANCSPVISSARAATVNPPPDATELLADSETVAAAQAVLHSVGLSAYVEKVDRLLACLSTLETAVRNQIHDRSNSVIEEISVDVRRMWSILHPNETIDGVRLRHPDDADKAIDIELSFHGVEQKSPRLTLSEGYRNSLGLCVFLSMARRSTDDTPVILDDVVVSLDRNHRGMIVELLEKEFADRQVIVFTHDREWYAELRQLLDQKNWLFRTLRPYGAPGDGIALSTKSSTFDDARSFLDSNPDVAGNTARKIMDIELGVRAERLELRMPYLQSVKNDHRIAHDFMTSLTSAAKKVLQVKVGDGYAPAAQVTALLMKADRLLMAWGNRASHTFDVVRPEAEKLIDACESALAALDCSSCGKPVHKFDDGNGTRQCSCGHLRWRYGSL